jgi:hypothetical protein
VTTEKISLYTTVCPVSAGSGTTTAQVAGSSGLRSGAGVTITALSSQLAVIATSYSKAETTAAVGVSSAAAVQVSGTNPQISVVGTSSPIAGMSTATVQVVPNAGTSATKAFSTNVVGLSPSSTTTASPVQVTGSGAETLKAGMGALGAAILVAAIL